MSLPVPSLSTTTEHSLTSPAALPTQRKDLISQLQNSPSFDLAVIGGGATGVGVALDAAARGLSVVLVEAHDFAKGTSSRATKLVHGGVRYLAQGNITLVREALRERQSFFANAPHLAQPLPFVMPAYGYSDLALYGAGLTLYDAIAGKASVGRTRWLSAADVRSKLPGLQDTGLRGGIRYWDGQFDDARMVLAIARTAAAYGALLLNHCRVTSLIQCHGKVRGVRIQDQESGADYEIQAKCVVNAAGVWSETVQSMVDSASSGAGPSSLRPSQGTHVVVDRSFWPCEEALLIPKTEDGRVLFAIPWLGATLLGTTDTASTSLPTEPMPAPQEIEFILREASRYLRRPARRADVKSAWAGLRPLAAKPANRGATSSVSREHAIEVSDSGLVNVTGGKWTTYRLMAEQVMATCFKAGLLHAHSGSTARLALVGAGADSNVCLSKAPGYHLYGSEQHVVRSLPGASCELVPGLTEAMVRFAVRHEYARSVEDVLARRSRLLFLDAAAAETVAPRVGEILLQELDGIDPGVAVFQELCDAYGAHSAGV